MIIVLAADEQSTLVMMLKVFRFLTYSRSRSYYHTDAVRGRSTSETTMTNLSSVAAWTSLVWRTRSHGWMRCPGGWLLRKLLCKQNTSEFHNQFISQRCQ